jgi:hypothetical protein
MVTACLLGGVSLLVAPQFVSAQARVPAAEAAVELLLPEGATVQGSRRLNTTQAEVLVEIRGEISPIVMAEIAPGRWQQDMQATLNRGAEEMQRLAQSSQLPGGPAFGQTAGESLLQTSTSATTLIEPSDPEAETQRALGQSGRSNPFVPLDRFEEPVDIADPIPVPDLPPLPPIEDLDLPSPDTTAALDQPQEDPARFARSVEVSGIVSIDGESYALVSAAGTVPSVVQPGQDFETASVNAISAREKEVVLMEGGEVVTKSVGN